ncbi:MULTISPECIES: formate/nitrite transporter family protein [unclassified Campylobacter]|uniref:formate/nitrite transporter family protein n=1 Tax=unclassified Campylobacter TaxID=2593542 RepID=UPI003D3599AA
MLTPQENAKALVLNMTKKAQAPLKAVIIMSIMAGGAIAMGDIFWAHSTVGMAQTLSIGMSNFIGGLAFSCGLMMVVFYGGHLFTGSVISGVGAYDSKIGWIAVFRYLSIIWVFNFVGSVMVAYMYYYSGLPQKFNATILKTFVTIGTDKVTLSFVELFLRGIFCNIFVCMAVWSANMQKDIAGKFFTILWMVAAFVACSMEHCVANMFIITEALLAKADLLVKVGSIEALSELLKINANLLYELNITNFLVKNLVPVTLGNIIGGFLFVGLVGFISAKSEEENDS